jgi:signal transduction histidine kinase
LVQAIFNIVTNAVTHAAAKQVQIVAEDHGDEVVLRVTNYGTAIPLEIQDSIFDPFLHTDTASATTKTGLGLGLFIVKEIIVGHEGTVIEVVSTEAEGTTFTIKLPRVPASHCLSSHFQILKIPFDTENNERLIVAGA